MIDEVRLPASTIMATCAYVSACICLTASPALAVLTADKRNKSVKIYEKHAQRTKASKLYKYVQPQRTVRGRLVPNSGLTAQGVASQVKVEIDDKMCAYFNKRNYHCSYQLADIPDKMTTLRELPQVCSSKFPTRRRCSA